ncbi:MAG: alkaline phosphatase family protein [Mycobacteriales bacterium]
MAAVVTAIGLALAAPSADATTKPTHSKGHIKHLVVIYEENHSFDNLYGRWGSVGGQRVDGLAAANRAHTVQVRQDGAPYKCLLQNDVNLSTPLNTPPGPLPVTCSEQVGTTTIDSHFRNRPFSIDDYIHPSDTTCPAPGDFSHPNGIPKGTGLPGGCTRDLVHRFYQEQYQLNGGMQNRYVTGSDAVGLTMGGYDTKQLPIYKYLHSQGAPNYVLADHFFQGAFGGSYLNHQWLIAGQAPTWASAPDGEHAVLDSNAFPKASYPLYTSPQPTTTHDGTVTQKCGLSTTIPGRLCGDYTVNTVLPPWQPTATYAPHVPAFDDTSTPMNIGDQLSDAGVSWGWFAGGWDNAAGNVGGAGWTNGTTPGTCGDPNAAQGNYPYCPDKSFQPHHQPFNYYTRYAPGTADRAAHLKDEKNFIASAQAGSLPAVSFVKPVGSENEHPGYASEPNGSDHLVDLLKAIDSGPDAEDTLVVVTYDEFGGQWDHVSPPGQGNNAGPHDLFGPGTRIPALVIGRALRHSAVDHTSYDSTSIIASIERVFGLPALSDRAASVHDLAPAIRAGYGSDYRSGG